MENLKVPTTIGIYRCMTDCHQRETLTHVGNYYSSQDILACNELIMPAYFKQFYGRHLKIAYKEVSFESIKENKDLVIILPV